MLLYTRIAQARGTPRSGAQHTARRRCFPPPRPPLRSCSPKRVQPCSRRRTRGSDTTLHRRSRAASSRRSLHLEQPNSQGCRNARAFERVHTSASFVVCDGVGPARQWRVHSYPTTLRGGGYSTREHAGETQYALQLYAALQARGIFALLQDGASGWYAEYRVPACPACWWQRSYVQHKHAPEKGDFPQFVCSRGRHTTPPFFINKLHQRPPSPGPRPANY